MLVPGGAVGGGVVDHAKLAYRMDGMGIEIGRATVHAVVCGAGGLRLPRTLAIKGELDSRE
jgi:hypothetical protein